jgi:antitoxin component YwqK of YwqJK toxin-antitoxin module
MSNPLKKEEIDDDVPSAEKNKEDSSKFHINLSDVSDVSDVSDASDAIEEIHSELLEPVPAVLNGIHSTSSDDGTTTTVNFEDGKKSGLAQILENGRLVMEMYFLKDVLNGAFKYYFSNKALQILMNYSDNKLEGDFIQYYPDGSVQLKTYYQKGLQQGKSQTFDQHGNLVQEMTYINGMLDGPVNTYNNGDLIARTYYKEGVEVMNNSKPHI